MDLSAPSRNSRMTAFGCSSPEPGAAIETHDLVRKFGKVTALDGLNLHVEPGGAYGLIGNNGAGKTTAIHSLLGFLPPDRGEIRVLGLQPGKDSIRIRQRVGFFSERDAPYDWMRVRSVFKMASLAYTRWDWALCQKLRDRFGIDSRKRVKELSKGMVAKVKLILALSHAPECLILDEPTSGLDPGSRNDLLTMIVELRRERGISTLFSSHNLDDVADIATHIGILHEGRLVFSAPMNRIRERLALAQFSLPIGKVPEELQAQIVCRRSQDGVTQWLIADRDNSAVRNFVDRIGQQNVQWKPVTLKKLFLFLTSAGLVD
jgi:ABC-2 type transport system ATP-binding protein